MESYHRPVTPAVTFNPYLPPRGRVLEVLRGSAPAGTTIEITNRDLAAAAECSAGSIPGILRALEADGHIERITSPRGSLIVCAPSDQLHDRSFTASGCDQLHDRLESSDQASQSLIAPEAPAPSDQRVDPPHTPLYGRHDSMQQQHARVRFADGDSQAATIDRLLRIGLWGEEIAEWARQYGYTPDYVELAWKKAQTRADLNDPHRLVYACLKRNEPVYSQEELHERAQSVRPAARAGADPHHTRPAHSGSDAGRRAAAERPGARRDAPSQPALSITPEQARALPRRGTERLQALLEQRARQGGSGGSAC